MKTGVKSQVERLLRRERVFHQKTSQEHRRSTKVEVRLEATKRVCNIGFCPGNRTRLGRKNAPQDVMLPEARDRRPVV